MKPVHPSVIASDARLVVFAKNQPEYTPLPAGVSPDGTVMTEWELSAEDLAVLLNGGRVRLWIHTFGQRLQPVSIEAVNV